MSDASLSFQPVGGLVARKGDNIISSEVIQALEIARESPEAAVHGAIGDMLEAALAGIWARIEADQFGYVMSKDEFAIFNYYQARFRDNPVATRARKRYWDHTSAPPQKYQGA